MASSGGEWVARRWAQLRRDVGMLVGPFVGRRPSPLVRRSTPRRVVEGPLAGRRLRVVEVVRETDDAVSLWLEPVVGAPLAFAPGQFLTVLVTVGGEELRRAYSVSSHADDQPRLRLTIKRVDGGKVSHHLHDHVGAGDELRVLGPSGDFVVGAPRQHVLLVGGGSGITPLMALARAALRDPGGGRVTLLYGNRGVGDVIFHRELQALATAHPTRMSLRYVLSEPPTDASEPDCVVGRGLLDEATCERVLADVDLEGVEAFVCGPEPMMVAARAALEARGLAPDAIREERFTQPHLRATSSVASESQPIELRHDGRVTTFRTEPGQTVLDAGLAAGVPMGFSCAMGGCAACKVRLVEGAVHMEEPNCLTQRERAEGLVLACVARPTSPVVVEALP